MKRIIKNLIKLLVLIGLVVAFINASIIGQSKAYVYKDIEDLPEKEVIIVLGAFVRGNNLSYVLEDRVLSAMKIEKAGKSERFLLSGDHGQKDYDEVNAMKNYILSNDESIDGTYLFLDHAGFDTYDSLYRAKEVFQVENAIIVTQDFHINRAVYIARALGVDAVGYSVNQDRYLKSLQFKWSLRESLSRVKAFADVHLNSKAKYLGDVISIKGDGQATWD